MAKIEGRCDRCGARGVSRWKLPSGKILTFCGHHTNKHADKLAEVALDPSPSDSVGASAS